MKVLDLQCSQGHSFEGWFGSQDDYDAQRARGLVTCPVCNDSEILKMLSAPRLNLGHGVAPESLRNPTPASTAPAGTAKEKAAPAGVETTVATQALAAPADTHTLQQVQAAMLNMLRQVMANTEDVGPQFAEEARKIHYGESEERSIRGHATREETEALLEEGIEVMSLPVPESLKGPLQ
jgi:hypothetical protein